MPDHEIPASRRRIDLSANWTFSRGRRDRHWPPIFRWSDQEVVSLPHSWNRTDTFQPGVPYYQGAGNYSRTFFCPTEWLNQLVWLCSEGFYGTGQVWVNGRSVGRVNGQFLGFRLPVERVLEPGADNDIACRLTNRCGRRELPGIRYPDFLLHGGLAGRVWLEATPQCYLDHDSFYMEALAGTSPARVLTRVRLINAGPQSVRTTVVWSLLSSGGEPVTDDVCVSNTIPAGKTEEISSVLTASDVALWSDHDPHLYHLRGTLQIHDRPVDSIQRRIGFRNAVFRDGHLVRNWDGHVALMLRGGARAFPYVPERILVAGGCGRIPIAVDAAQADATWHVEAENLQSTQLTITDSRLLSSLQ